MIGLFDWFRSVAKSDTADVPAAAVETGESAEIAGLDFKAAITAHQQWKIRLQAYIDGTSQEKLDPAVVGRDDQCVLGKWINGAGAKEFGAKPVFSRLKAEHAQFHLIAGDVVSAMQRDRKEEAVKILDTTFILASVRVQHHLADLFLEVHH